MIPFSENDPTKSFKIEHKYSPELDDPNAEIEIAGKKMKVKEFREIEKKYKKSFEDSREEVVVIWDDICQFTSLGLIDYIKETYDFDLDYDISTYFKRTEPNIPKYVTELFNLNGFEIKLETVQDIYKKEYRNILERSPMTNTFISIMRCVEVYSSLTFFFAYEFDGIKTLVESIISEFGEKMKKIYYKVVDDIDDKTLVEKKFPSHWKTVFSPNLSEVLLHILENERHDCNLFAPDYRSGIGGELHVLGKEVTGNSQTFLYGTKINYFEEGVVYVPV